MSAVRHAVLRAEIDQLKALLLDLRVGVLTLEDLGRRYIANRVERLDALERDLEDDDE